MARHPINMRKWSWKIGGGIALFMLVLAIGNHFLPDSRSLHRRMLGHDFLVFYSGGLLARTGQYHELYNMDTLKRMEHDTGVANDLEMGKGFGPWWNPPHAAWMFAPLTVMGYPQALITWQTIGMAAFAVSVLLMIRMFPDGTSWTTWALVPLLMVISMPFIQALSHGQNTFITLLLLTITATLWRTNRGYLAGVVCGLLAYKPQHCALIGLVLVISQGFPAACGLATTGAATLLFTTIAMPGALHDFLTRMPENLRQFQENNHYMWERHVTLKAFWRLLLQGRELGGTSPIVMTLWFACWSAIAALLAKAIWTSHSEISNFKSNHLPTRVRAQTDRLIAATIAATPLLMPFYFDYDLLLISVAAVLYAADRMRTPYESHDRWGTLAWTGLFLCFEFGTAMAGRTRFNPTVVLMSFVAAVLIQRASKRESIATIAATIADDLPISLPLAA